jgi:hypothetical protein
VEPDQHPISWAICSEFGQEEKLAEGMGCQIGSPIELEVIGCGSESIQFINKGLTENVAPDHLP